MINMTDDQPTQCHHMCVRAALAAVGLDSHSIGLALHIEPRRIDNFLRTGNVYDRNEGTRDGLQYDDLAKIVHHLGLNYGVTMSAYRMTGHLTFVIPLKKDGARVKH